ncbi:MAG: ABC transporter substrate-binding protein [Chloroflexi bacterium]|nr:ABC transporter substrate-binding protein [Chloroflexota bacterium]
MERAGFHGRLSRRAALRSGGIGVAGLAGAVLIGCGDSDEATATPGGANPTTAATTAPGGSTTTAATPAPSGPKTGGRWQIRASGDPPTLDPYSSGSFAAKQFAGYVYSRLFKVDAQPDTNPYDRPLVPDVAESAESPDGQNWTIKLKEGITFHDVAPVSGRELTADDVLFSWKRLTREESVNAPAVENVTNIEAVDDHTLNITLESPSPIFLEQLADGNNLWLLPQEADAGLEVTTNPIGTGPWMMRNYEVSARFEFDANPNYHEPIYLDGIDELIIPEYSNALAQLEAGNLHELTVTADDILPLQQAHEDFQWIGQLSGGVAYMFFSSEEQDPGAVWQDKRFRQGVSMGLNRADMLELAYNVNALDDAGLNPSRAWNNLISPTLGKWWLDPTSAAQGPSSRFWDYDVSEGKKLIAAAGGEGSALKWQFAGTRYGPVFELVAESISNWLTDLGLDVTTEVQDYASTYFPQTRAGVFNGVAYGITPAYPEVSGFVNRYFSGASSNASKIDDPRINDLRAAQAIEFDEDRRLEQFHEIQRINGEEMYYLPTALGAGTTYTAFAAEGRGMRSTRGYGWPTERLTNYWLDV